MTQIMSWNVNGIRAGQRKGFLPWLAEAQPDILCLQETKAHPDQLDEVLRNPDGYHTFWASAEKKGYSGVAIYSKTEPLRVQVGIGIPAYDREGRTLIAEYDNFVLASTYVPSGSRDYSRVEYKLRYLDAFFGFLEGMRFAGKSIVFCGDINIAHHDIDLARPKSNKKTSGFLPEERERLDELEALGYIDTFRALHPEQADAYSWWAMRMNARERNVGWRLDHVWISADLRPKLTAATIHADIHGSDHCPVSITLEDN